MAYTQNNSPFLKVSKDDMPCNKAKAQSSGTGETVNDCEKK